MNIKVAIHINNSMQITNLANKRNRNRITEMEVTLKVIRGVRGKWGKGTGIKRYK